MRAMSASSIRRFAIALLLAFGVPLASAAPKPAVKGYDHYLTGSGADASPSTLPTRPTAVLMGGGPDVNEAFRWMIQKAGGGDFVVLRATGADGYNQYIFDMGGLDSVETLVVKTREAASDPFVLQRVRQAEAVFIAGGDQSDYIRLWKGTPLHAALDALVARNVPIGGTSAGLAVLGAFDFSGLNGTLYSNDALADPYNRRETLDRGFLALPGLANTLVDAHVEARDRMGRMVSLVARTVQDGWASVAAARAVGVDVETALLVDNGIASRVGVGAAWFLRPSIAPTVCQPKTPLTFRNVMVWRLDGAGSFDLNDWSLNGANAYDLSAEAGALVSSQAGGSPY